MVDSNREVWKFVEFMFFGLIGDFLIDCMYELMLKCVCFKRGKVSYEVRCYELVVNRYIGVELIVGGRVLKWFIDVVLVVEFKVLCDWWMFGEMLVGD